MQWSSVSSLFKWTQDWRSPSHMWQFSCGQTTQCILALSSLRHTWHYTLMIISVECPCDPMKWNAMDLSTNSSQVFRGRKQFQSSLMLVFICTDKMLASWTQLGCLQGLQEFRPENLVCTKWYGPEKSQIQVLYTWPARYFPGCKWEDFYEC